MKIINTSLVDTISTITPFGRVVFAFRVIKLWKLYTFNFCKSSGALFLETPYVSVSIYHGLTLNEDKHNME